MLTSATATAPPVPIDQTATAKAAKVEVSARTAFRDEQRLATKHESEVANNAAALAQARQKQTEVPDPMNGLSTVAVAGAMNSLPAALNMMRSIVMASAAGTLSDADRQTLQSEYAKLTARAVSSVGSTSAAEQAQLSKSRDEHRGDNAENTWRESSDDHRTTLTRTTEVARDTVQYQTAEQTTTVQRQQQVADTHASQPTAQVSVPAQGLHVGADSYEPVPVRQSTSSPAQTTPYARLETRSETQHSVVTQAAQVTQFVQVAQTETIPPVVAVA